MNGNALPVDLLQRPKPAGYRPMLAAVSTTVPRAACNGPQAVGCSDSLPSRRATMPVKS